MSDEPRYTHTERKIRELERECAMHGHVAANTIRSYDGPTKAYCECGMYAYTPKRVREPLA